MARFNEILVGRFSRALQKTFAIKGSAPAPILGSEIMAGVQMFWGAEQRYLEGWNRFGQDVPQAAVAAQNSGVRLRNPAASNVIAVVEKLQLNSFSVVDTPFLQINAVATDLSSIFNTANARFDPRGNPQPSMILSNGTNVASIAGTKAQTNMPLATAVDLIWTDIQEFPLLPGDAMQIVTTAVNAAIHVTLWWRERFLEDSERT